ncbi:PAS domain-containing protein [Stakelama tenebrarum]|uniref:histidine kinase n=1 Tax=Stakelama tenebrarum TaxID=2711215 RepID=A0A6G6Y7W3_9SPHN|nr:PAS domain-containing protein [Sphingosinithalassobacter tenebrarum]QIG81032.1 PAS domain-containing protein [Sphingosinithalassobacter tenebrarum]
MARRLALRLALGAVAIALLSIFGWLTGLTILTNGGVGGARMSLSTDFLTLLVVGAILLESRNRDRRFAGQPAARWLSLAALAAALWFLVGDALRFWSGKDPVAASGVSPGTAFCFTLLAASLALRTGSASHKLYFPLLLTALVPAFVAMIGYIYDLSALHSLSFFFDLSLPTTLTLLLLVAAAMILRGAQTPLRVAMVSGQAGRTARQLLAASVVVPVLAAALFLLLARQGVPVAIAIAANAALLVIAFGCLNLVIASLLERSERLRREREHFNNVIIENTPAVIYLKDREGRYQLVNQGLCDVTGVPREQLLGRTDAEVFPTEYADTWRETDLRAMHSEHGIREEEVAAHGGGIQYFLSFKSPYYDDSGELAGLYGVSSEITERKLAEQRLADQNARLALLDQITRTIGQRQDLSSIFQVATGAVETALPADFACILIYHADEEVLAVSHLAAHSTPLGEEMSLATGARVSIAGNRLSRCVFERELIYEPHIETLDYPLPRRLADHGFSSLVLAPIPIDNEVHSILCVARREPASFSSVDCEFLRQLGEHLGLSVAQGLLHAELRNAYDDLKHTQDAAIERERLSAIGQMASGIAHDINNAISPVAIYTQSLIERDLAMPQELRDYLAIVDGVVRDISATAARMRDFYRARDSESKRSQVDLNQLIPQVIDLTRARWRDMPQQRGIVVEMQTELAADLPCISANATELREVLTNLVFNAVDALPNGGTITLRTEVSQSESSGAPAVDLYVVDTGEGMDAETRKRCLEPFFSTKGERGTGLGLAMVFGAAKRHDAQIEIESAPGAGTRFRIRFPVTAIQKMPEKHMAKTPAQALRILLIDDDPAVLKSTLFVLELDKHKVQAEGDSRRGIATAEAAAADGRPFDVVITDLGMPHVDGDQVAKAVKAASPGTTVILLTGWGQRMDDGKQARSNIDHILAKPPQLEELREVLAQVGAPRD